jgi:hypothetical protein
MKALVTFVIWLWSLAKVGFARLFGYVGYKQAPFTFEMVDDMPEMLKPMRVYLVGEDKNLWAAAMICPCGCGDKIELNLLKATRPCWNTERHTGGLITLSPSVWRQKGCRSHFILRRGQITWC